MARRAPALVLLLLALAAAGCEGGGGDGVLGGSVTRGKPNGTDAAFIRAMVPHQVQGVAIAETAGRRARRSELRKIGPEIADAQRPSIARLRALAPQMPPPSGSGVGPKPGKIDVRRLRDPVSFDHQFLGLMIRHHEDAIAMAEEEQDRGGDERVKKLAAEIFKSQSRELEQLRRWLNTWYGEGVLPGEGGGGGGGGGGEEPPGGEGGGGEDPPI